MSVGTQAVGPSFFPGIIAINFIRSKQLGFKLELLLDAGDTGSILICAIILLPRFRLFSYIMMEKCLSNVDIIHVLTLLLLICMLNLTKPLQILWIVYCLSLSVFFKLMKVM